MADVYNLYDLNLLDPSQPGDIVFVQVRARTLPLAQMTAARFAGREGREAWTDPSRVVCEDRGEALVQWAGVVVVHGHEWYPEGQAANQRRADAVPKFDLAES